MQSHGLRRLAQAPSVLAATEWLPWISAATDGGFNQQKWYKNGGLTKKNGDLTIQKGWSNHQNVDSTLPKSCCKTIKLFELTSRDYGFTCFNHQEGCQKQLCFPRPPSLAVLRECLATWCSTCFTAFWDIFRSQHKIAYLRGKKSGWEQPRDNQEQPILRNPHIYIRLYYIIWYVYIIYIVYIYTYYMVYIYMIYIYIIMYILYKILHIHIYITLCMYVCIYIYVRIYYVISYHIILYYTTLHLYYIISYIMLYYIISYYIIIYMLYYIYSITIAIIIYSASHLQRVFLYKKLCAPLVREPGESAVLLQASGNGSSYLWDDHITGESPSSELWLRVPL